MGCKTLAFSVTKLDINLLQLSLQIKLHSFLDLSLCICLISIMGPENHISEEEKYTRVNNSYKAYTGIPVNLYVAHKNEGVKKHKCLHLTSSDSVVHNLINYICVSALP